MGNHQSNAADKILTISVAAYNAESWLGRCLRSLVENEAASSLDVIVVNDGSSDGTLAVAQSFESEHPDVVRVLDKENGGHGSTINAAIDSARGRYFKVVDSDDWVEKKGIERLVRALKHANCDIVLNSFFEVDANTGEKQLANDIFDSAANPIGKAVNVDEVNGDLHLVMHAMTFRTELLQDSPYQLDEHCFYVDNEYIVYYFSLCETMMLLDWPVYDYLLGTSEQSMNYHNMLKRRAQHERVCLACAEFCSAHSELAGKRARVAMGVAIRMLAGTYRILACLPYGMSRKEMAAFDLRLKDANPRLYDAFLEERADELVAKVVRRLRARGFRRYLGINVLYRVKYRCLHEDAAALGEAK